MRAFAVLLLCGLGLLVVPGMASAHPLGSLSVNHYDGLRVHADRVDVLSVVDSAEIPTLQDKDPAGADERCAELAKSLDVTADEALLTWSVGSARIERPAGEAGLPTTRLTCELTAPLRVDGEIEVVFSDSYLADRPGWREITAVGVDVAVSGDGVRAESVSGELRRYPDDPLRSPLDDRGVRLLARPGEGTGAPLSALPEPIAKATSAFTGLVGDRDLTPWVGAAAILLSIVLGASHAALPGHGKTVMAAYLAGSRGTSRDALLVGATVTATHTVGVLVLGLLLSVSSTLAGDSVLRWLGLASGVLVATIGGLLLRSAIRNRGHGHGHDHGHGHGHGHGHRFGRAGLIGMGVAGGLVPSPSALVVLLGAVALGRTWFGVLLVFAYGAGMAAMLTVAGLVLVKVRDRFSGAHRLRRLAEFAPVGTAALVFLVGLGLATRALAG